MTPPLPRKPRCYLLYALAPEETSAADANRLINELVADTELPLAIFHDHFIGQKGGMVIFFVESVTERDRLYAMAHLADWQVIIHPLIYSYNPAAFDAQTAYTLSRYRQADWDILKQDKRPPYGDLQQEANLAEESD